MRTPIEQTRSGLEYLDAATTLLQRVRAAHPTKGLYEAADLCWWWRMPRPTDDLRQLFWFDDAGRPEAAVIATDWGDRIALDPIVLPDATPEWVAHVVQRGIAHAADLGFDEVELEVDRIDDPMIAALAGHGFSMNEDGMVETWLAVDQRPVISALHDSYRLARRLDTTDGLHHMAERSGATVESRLRQTPLYRPDLDFVVLDSTGQAAGYGLFWFDPETKTGLVEPMRTHDEHQQRGLARHILTAGLDALATTGAERIKIVYEPDNPASGHLYLSVGFEPVKETVGFSGRVHA